MRKKIIIILSVLFSINIFAGLYINENIILEWLNKGIEVELIKEEDILKYRGTYYARQWGYAVTYLMTPSDNSISLYFNNITGLIRYSDVLLLITHWSYISGRMELNEHIIDAYNTIRNKSNRGNTAFIYRGKYFYFQLEQNDNQLFMLLREL